jgi:uncharacterized integral membrane protein
MTQQFDDERRSADSGLTGRQKFSLGAGVVVTILLVAFILSNTDRHEVGFLAWNVEVPLWLALLFAAVAGVLLWPLLRKTVRGMRQRDERR